MVGDEQRSWDADAWSPTRITAIMAHNLLDTPGGIYFFKDLDSRFIAVSDDCAALVGRTPEQMIGLSDFDITDRAHAEELYADEQRVIATGEPLLDKSEADRFRDETGTWAETSKFPLRDLDGTIIGTFGYARDVTRRMRAEQEVARMAQSLAQANAELMQAEAQLKGVLDGSLDAIARYDPELRYRYANPAGLRFKGASLEELVGRTDRETGMRESWLAEYEPALRRVLETGVTHALEFAGPDMPDRQETWYHVSVSPDRDVAGDVVGVLVSMRDVSVLKRAERVLRHQAMHDPLTGLANRLLLMDRLDEALVRLERHPGRLGLFFVDVDRLKDVNDSHGHDTGDLVLVEVADRLRSVSRQEDTVARLGGDEYVVMCSLTGSDDLGQIADRMVRSMSEPFRLGR